MKQIYLFLTVMMFAFTMNGQYIYSDFDGTQNVNFTGWPNAPVIVNNPDASGINTSANVAEFTRSTEQWAHVFVELDGYIDFTTGSTFQLKVYSPITCEILFKLEDKSNSGIFTEVMGNVTEVNQWEQLTYDFSGTASGTYDKIVIFFDFATANDNTFYFDDVEGPEFGGGSTSDPVTLPVTFEDENVGYNLVDFGGNVSSIIVDPTNAGNMVAQSIKTDGAETWAGTTIGGTAGFPTPIPFTADFTSMSVRVWSPTSGTPIRLKVEDYSDPTKSVETETNTTVDSDWETIIFDFSNEAPGTEPIHLEYYYNKASIFFDFASVGTGETYYWDDVEFIDYTFVDQRSVRQLSIARNPVEDVLILDNLDNIETVYSYSLTGQTIELKKVGNNVFDVSGMNNGIYTVLAIDRSGKNYVGKILKL